MGPRDPYDRKVESPHLLLRVFEAMTLLISNPESKHVSLCSCPYAIFSHTTVV